jgi:uncharacterized integral membrane protein (TIGR00698 family)
MHEVAQVVAAGHAISPDAENAAVIAKMLRVMMLAPFLIFLAARVKQLAPEGNAQKGKITIPWFAIFFILVAIFNSFHLLPKAESGLPAVCQRPYRQHRFTTAGKYWS